MNAHQLKKCTRFLWQTSTTNNKPYIRACTVFATELSSRLRPSLGMDRAGGQLAKAEGRTLLAKYGTGRGSGGTGRGHSATEANFLLRDVL